MSRSPAAVLFDVSGNLAVIQSGFPATGTVTGSAPGVMMAGSDGQFARLLKTTSDGTLHVSGSVTTTPTGVQQVTGSVGVTGSVAITHVVPVAVQGQVGVNNFPAVQAVSGSVSTYTQGAQGVSGSVSVHTDGPQAVSGTVNVGNWPPIVAVTGSQPTGSTHQGSPVVVGGVFTSGSYIKSLYVDVSGALYVTTSGSLPVTGGIQVLNQVAVSGAIHITNQVINVTGSAAVTGSLAVDNVVRVTATGSLPVHLDSQVQVSNFPTVQAVSGSVATYTQGPQLVSGTVAISGSVATYTHGPQLISGTVAVSGSVSVYTQGPQAVTGTVGVNNFPETQRVSGSVAVYTQGAQLVSGTVNLGNWPPVMAVSGSQLTGSTFNGMPVVAGGTDDDEIIRAVRTDAAGNQYVISTSTPAEASSSIASGWVLYGGSSGILTAIRSTVYTEQTGSFQRSVKSTSANDSASGTGAQQIKVTYYDDDVNGPFAETITLNGLTAVNTTATNMRYIEKIEVTRVGSSGWNLGTISLFTAPGGVGGTIGSIGFGNIVSSVGDNLTLWAHHYVKNILTSSITGMTCGTNGNQVAVAHMRVKNLVTGSNPEIILSDLIAVANADGTVTRNYTSPIKVLGPARVTLYVVSNGTNTRFFGGFDYSEQE